MIIDKIRYRFIGTRQDLVDNGFILLKGPWGDSNYLRDVDGDDTIEIYINMDPLGERLVQNNLGDDDLIIPHIQDLIEKNLVREYKGGDIPIAEARYYAQQELLKLYKELDNIIQHRYEYNGSVQMINDLRIKIKELESELGGYE